MFPRVITEMRWHSLCNGLQDPDYRRILLNEFQFMIDLVIMFTLINYI